MYIFFNENQLKESTGIAVYNRGLDMYLRNKVKRLEFDTMASNEVLISSTVESAYGNWDYKIKIYKGKNSNTAIGSCTCEAFSEYKQCKHLVAATIKYIREDSSILGDNSTKITNYKLGNLGDELLHLYKTDVEAETSFKNEIKLEIKLVIESNITLSYSVELKVGTSKTYVVKNLREFLQLLKSKNSTMEFGKGFILDFHEHFFNDSDKLILDFLQEINETTELLSTRYSFYGPLTSLLSGKKAYLTELQLVKLLKLMENKSINLTAFYRDYINIPVSSRDLPLDFSMDLENDEIKLKHQGELPEALSENKRVFLYENTIFIPSEDQIKVLAPLLKVLSNKKNNSISFSKEQSNDVATYLFPKIKAISSSLKINDTLKSIIYEEPLVISIFLDKVSDDLTCDVKFSYGDITFNPIKAEPAPEHIVIIKDIVKETKILNLLNELGFAKLDTYFSLADEELIIDFITEGIDGLHQLADVYYSEAFKDIKLVPSSSIKASITLNNANLLEFDFSIDGIPREELKNVFNAVKEKKKYYRLKNGHILPLTSPEITGVYGLMDNLDVDHSKLAKGNIVIPKYASLYIDESIKENNINFISKNKSFRELINNIKEVQDADYEIPQQLNQVLREYQKIGFKWFKTLSDCGFGGILGDEMGLGKTLQAISFMTSQIVEKNLGSSPILVICPTSLVYNWINEIEKFAPYLKTLAISGGKNDRALQMESILEYDVIITSYPLLRRDIDFYADITFKSCFIDEAQHIKNPNSQSARCVKEIKSPIRFALTGTPIENSLTELWSIFDFIMPGYLKNHSRFDKKYEVPIIKDKDQKAMKELTKLIKPFILRRYKKDVVKELPPKIEHKVVVEMTELQKKIYASYVNSYKEEIREEIKQNGLNKSKIKILSLLTRLRQICCDPSSFIDDYTGDSGKLLALEEILEDAISSNHRILLFSQFTTVLNHIKTRLDKRSIKYMYLDGNIPSIRRVDMVNDFNTGDTEVFLISLKAGGTGLNLTGADMVIHFDPWWNPAVEEQAIDRAHRIGQTKTVEVIRLIAKGTIEEKIYDLQENKRQMVQNILDVEQHNEVFLSSMGVDEIESLFS